MAFSEEVKIKAMVACGRRCCLCHKFCGNNMEVHHIKAHADGGSDRFENAIPLCFDCHAIVRQYDPKHPKGIKFTEKELMMHRDAWYKKVEQGITGEKANVVDEQVEDIKMHHQEKYQDIMLYRINEGKQLMYYLQGASAILYEEEAENLNEVKVIGNFLQYICELIDSEDLMDEPYDRIMTAYNLTESIREIEKIGFWVFAGKENRRLTGGVGEPEQFPVLLIKIIKKGVQ